MIGVKGGILNETLERFERDLSDYIFDICRMDEGNRASLVVDFISATFDPEEEDVCEYV